MSNLLDFYQHIPEHINPIALSIGSFSIRHYSIMYLVAFATVYFLLVHRIKKKENTFEINKNQLADLLIYSIIGLIVGARLGYVIFYNLPYYINNPLEIILPISVSDYGLRITGLYGMSYYGGLIGAILAGYIFCRRRKINFWSLADFVIPAIPAGYFFGRIGNFLNGELYGRITEKFWGMHFPGDSLVLLRHPSQLYEAFFEGLVLFAILWTFRNRLQVTGYRLQIYLLGYGFSRFFIEFFREPDLKIGLIYGIITLGQAFSILIMTAGIGLILARKHKNAIIS